MITVEQIKQKEQQLQPRLSEYSQARGKMYREEDDCSRSGDTIERATRGRTHLAAVNASSM